MPYKFNQPHSCKPYLRKMILGLSSFMILSVANAAPSIEGAYNCPDCFGYLTVTPTKSGLYKVWLGVGQGSCGGAVTVNGSYPFNDNNQFVISHKVKKKSCITTIAIQGDEATVTDSCTKPEDEEGSTCAILGDYVKE